MSISSVIITIIIFERTVRGRVRTPDEGHTRAATVFLVPPTFRAGEGGKRRAEGKPARVVNIALAKSNFIPEGITPSRGPHNSQDRIIRPPRNSIINEIQAYAPNNRVSYFYFIPPPPPPTAYSSRFSSGRPRVATRPPPPGG